MAYADAAPLLCPPVSHWHAATVDHSASADIRWPVVENTAHTEARLFTLDQSVQLREWAMEWLIKGYDTVIDIRLCVDYSAYDRHYRIDLINPMAALLFRQLMMADIAFGRCLWLQSFRHAVPHRSVILDAIPDDGIHCQFCHRMNFTDPDTTVGDQ